MKQGFRSESKYDNKYGVIVEQRSNDLGNHTLNGTIELRMLNAKNKPEAVRVAKTILLEQLGITVFVTDMKNCVWKEKAEFWEK